MGVVGMIFFHCGWGLHLQIPIADLLGEESTLDAYVYTLDTWYSIGELIYEWLEPFKIDVINFHTVYILQFYFNRIIGSIKKLNM